MSSLSPRTPFRPLVLATAAGLLLASCSSADDVPAEESSRVESPSPSTTVSIPPGTALTEPGSDLSFGEPAAVLFEPDQNTGTVLQLEVEAVTEGTVKDLSGFVLDDKTRASTPYYVDVTVENVGETDVGGLAVPLWGVDGANTLLPAATFTTSFRKCPSEQLPDEFPAGETLETCLVYLAPDGGTLEAVSFRPTQEFDPIRWTGEITTPEPEPKKKPRKPAKGKR